MNYRDIPIEKWTGNIIYVNQVLNLFYPSMAFRFDDIDVTTL